MISGLRFVSFLRILWLWLSPAPASRRIEVEKARRATKDAIVYVCFAIAGRRLWWTSIAILSRLEPFG